MLRRFLRLALLLAFASVVAAAAPAQSLHGAGATFPAPVYQAWAEECQRRTGQGVRYDELGSGAGIAAVTQGQVDFGASDAPLADDRLAAADLLQFPTVIGGVVPVVNVAGVAHGRLQLDAAALSAIYRGRIVNWSDPAIAALNPGLALPDARITVVHRADASGTTWLWSRWLSESDAAWRTEIGQGTTLAWPTGTGGLGNEGVASLVRRTRGAIGYVEAAYARAHDLADVALPARDGGLVRASPESFEAALASARWRTRADLAQSLVAAPGRGAWPLVGASYVLVPAQAPGTARTLAFFRWAITHGAAQAQALGYVPLPAAAVRLVEQSLPAAP
ncbi:MAG: phosphate ABC transporter substrate-binding protein PstS [Burkholderiaceae bacterium]